MTRRRLLLLPLLCALATVLCSARGASARQQNSLGVSPASVDARVKRGASYTETYTLSNNTSTRLRFRCSVLDYWYDDHNQRITGKPGTLPHSASTWIQFSPAEVTVEPHGHATVRAIITVPQTAAGGFYTMPVFEALPADAATHDDAPPTGMIATASIGFRFRGLVMLTTEEAAEYTVEIMVGSVRPPTPSAPLELELDVRNRSTTHARVRGAFTILDASGRLAGRGRIQEKRFMPGQRGDYRAEWIGELAAGRYTVVVTLSYDRVGMEPATLVYEMPFEARAVTASAVSR
jgi:hypothetical protein